MGGDPACGGVCAIIIPRLLFRPQRKLPDAILAELVAMLIAGRVPIVVMALTVTLVAFFAISAGSFITVVILAAIIILLLAIRFAIVTQYRRTVGHKLPAE